MNTERRLNIAAQISRAEEILSELKGIYTRDLESKTVSASAQIRTHEIAEKCANILDQTMTALFDEQIAPNITEKPKRGGYFPSALDESSYRSSLGQWHAANLSDFNSDLDQKLRALQPMTSPSNTVYARIRDRASKKHVGLVPQIRSVEEIVDVRTPYVQAIWRPSMVTFGPGASIGGIPIDPRTQLPANDPRISVRVEKWVSFLFSDTYEDAFGFCASSISATKRAVSLLLE